MLSVSIKPENFVGTAVQFSKGVGVNSNSFKQVGFTADEVSQLIIHQPRLWWPNGYGRANLYRINLKYIDNNGVSDDTTFVFGIRTVGSTATDVNGYVRRDFYVNGKRVHLVGGAWVPDMMVNRDSARYDYEMHLCRNANVNLVRIWGGGVTPPDAFWDAADRYGLMVWSDFWVTGDTQGEFKGSPDWPLEGNVFVKNVISTIYRVRNHPSLLVWTGGNEGHARKELYYAMRDNVIAMDGTRPFIPCSSGFAKLPAGWEGAYPDNKSSGVYSGGPYAWKDPKEYYKLADAGKDWVFKDETGIPSQPPYNTLAKVVTNLTWDTKLPFPLNNTWGYHDACTGAAKYDEYYSDMVSRYGQPITMVGFSDKMQLMNYTGYQGIFEADGHKLNETGGVMLWKLNSALPSVVWQIYDWYLEPNAGYYAMQNAVEPIHIQFNQDDSTVMVINRTFKGTGNLTAQADVYSLNSRSLYHRSAIVNLSSTGTTSAMPLKPILGDTKEFCFVVLKLTNASGKVVSRNTYWMAPNNDYKPLNNMDNANVTTKLIKTEKGYKEDKYTLQITNSSKRIAFFVRPQLMVKGEEVMPSYWSANYFSLAPGESTTVTVSAPTAKLGNEKPSALVSGWNVKEQVISTL